MESRYTNRFRGLGEKTGQQIKDLDSAGNLTEHLRHAKGSLEAQRENIKDLLATATEMIKGITTHQQMMKTDLVKNIPLPSAQVMASPSMQLGYVQLTMRFLQAGLVHFMEETHSAQERINSLEKTIGTLAESDQDLDVIGKLQHLDLDMLEGHDNGVALPSPPASVTSSPASPPIKSAKSGATPKPALKK